MRMAFLQASPTKHDEPDLGKDVVFHRAQPDAADRAEEAHRDNENDRERQGPALVKRRQQQEDKQNAEREDVDRAIAGELLLQRHFRPLGGEARRQAFLREPVDRGQSVTRAGARRQAGRSGPRPETCYTG